MVFFYVIWMVSFPVAAMEASLPSIETEGEAVVLAQPDQVEFIFRLESRGSTFSEALDGVMGFGAQLRGLLKTHDLAPLLVDVQTPFICYEDNNALSDSAKTAHASTSALLRFNLPSFGEPENAVSEYARLVDNVTQIAKEMNCLLYTPVLVVSRMEPIENETISRAIQNAFPFAQAAAASMHAMVSNVRHVEILEVSWPRTKSENIPPSTVKGIPCYAHVRVVYEIAVR